MLVQIVLLLVVHLADLEVASVSAKLTDLLSLTCLSCICIDPVLAVDDSALG